MQLVVSQAWTKDADGHADGYIATSAAFHDWLAACEGFVRRELVRGVEDRTHFINLRWWESIDDYLAITELPEYQAHLRELASHLDLAKYEEHGYPREFLDVVATSDGAR